jgi:hypothetical protein
MLNLLFKLGFGESNIYLRENAKQLIAGELTVFVKIERSHEGLALFESQVNVK